MFKMTNLCISILIIGLFTTTQYAQQKFEKESRISRQDVPSGALQFMDSADTKNKIKWYFEKGLDRSSIEAKFRKNTKKYSVEFDTIGNIEDVEIEVKWQVLPTELRDAIHHQLRNDCLKHKIVKVQIQFTGSNSALFKKLNETDATPGLTVKYEVIIKCKLTTRVNLIEYLFSDAGETLSMSKIVFKNSSHLEY